MRCWVETNLLSLGTLKDLRYSGHSICVGNLGCPVGQALDDVSWGSRGSRSAWTHRRGCRLSSEATAPVVVSNKWVQQQYPCMRLWFNELTGSRIINWSSTAGHDWGDGGRGDPCCHV